MPLFYGFSNHVIDVKLRLAIPAKFRVQLDPQLDTRLISVPWPTGHLRLYTERDFEAMVAPASRTLLTLESETTLLRSLFPYIERLEMASAGRVTFTKEQMEMIGLTHSVRVAGMQQFLEVGNVPDKAVVLAEFQGLPAVIKAERDRTALESQPDRAAR